MRAYFTPSPSEVGTLAQRVLSAAKEGEVVIDFTIGEEGADAFDLTARQLELTEVCVTPVGCELTGRLTGATNLLARVSVDTTVDPPVAIYTELTKD